jgi:hypothetical protein
MFSPSSAYRKKCCKDKPTRLISYRTFSSLCTHHGHAYRNFKRSWIMLCAKTLGTPCCYAVYRYPHVITNQRSHQLQCCFRYDLKRATWSGIYCDFRTLRLFLNLVVKQFNATNTSDRKQETILYKYLLHSVILPTKKKRTTERWSLVVYFSSTVAIFTTKTSLWICACAYATYTVAKLDCAAN